MQADLGFSVHICDEVHFLMLQVSFYKPKLEDPEEFTDWLEMAILIRGKLVKINK